MFMHRLPGRAAAAVCLFVAAAACQAGRPLQTEDAGVIAAADCEVEGARLLERTDGATEAENGLALACGVGLRSQLALGLARAGSGDAATRLQQLGGKTGLWRDGDEGPALTLAWSVGRAKEAGGGWRHDSREASLVASLPVDGATVHLNLGHAREVPTRLVATTWALAWERDPEALGAMAWAPMAELFGDDHGQAWWNVAARLTLLPGRAFVDLSFGRRWQGGPSRLATLGFKLAF